MLRCQATKSRAHDSLSQEIHCDPHKHSAISKKREKAVTRLLVLVSEIAGNLGENAITNCSVVDFCMSCMHTILEF